MTEDTRELIITGTTETGEPAGEFTGEPAPPAEVDEPADTTMPTTQTYRAPRGAWDFTEGQRIVIGILIWLIIIVLTIAYLAVTGQLPI